VTARPLAALVVLFFGCTTPAPPSPAQAYAQELEAAHLDAAYALTSPAFRAQVSAEEFRLRFADPAARQARATAVKEGLSELARAAPELFGGASAELPEAVVLRFATAVRAGHFDQAWRCLSAALRQRYSPETLSRDFSTEPTGASRLEQATRAAEGIAVREGNSVRFPLPGGGAVVVLQESDGWRLGALE
jgi:hypothetical protein